MTERDPYAVLGVPVHADADAIAGAYREQARRHHPDVSAAPDAERRMAEINAAWATLRDPARRAAWDRSNLRSQGPSGARPATGGRRPGTGPDGGPRRANGPATHAAMPGTPGWRQSPAAQARPGAAGPPPAWRRGPDGEGAAGPPPGPRRGSVLPFGRHIGWSLGEIARVDPGYLLWLRDRHEGVPYRAEIEQLLAATAGPPPPPPPAHGRRRRGLFR